jgi:hypothetical protein
MIRRCRFESSDLGVLSPSPKLGLGSLKGRGELHDVSLNIRPHSLLEHCSYVISVLRVGIYSSVFCDHW